VSTFSGQVHALGNALVSEAALLNPSWMRSRYRVNEPHAAYFITATIVAWLPVFTTAERCNIVVESLKYCRAHKQLEIFAWVILDNHLHAVLSAPELPRVLADFKRHTAQRLLEKLEAEKCEWLLNQLRYFRASHKNESEHQVWQEGSHPQAIGDDRMMLQKMDYVHDNPVRRGLVAGREHWRYSSAHEACVGAEPLFVCDPWQ
jgi:putative transposase